METGKCYRCGYCCGGCLVPKDDESDLSPYHLASLASEYGEAYARAYAREHSVPAGERCPWLMTNPDGVTTSCSVYDKRSAVCRMHNANADCTIGSIVMKAYGYC
ncbi:MAG: YkgJ family cysteine cluster protein [Clostridiales bacterium]|nr:YkgJ family cysteine cluster protein [Clostridiales bacterium]